MNKYLQKCIKQYQDELLKRGYKMEFRFLDDSVVSKDGKVKGLVPRKHYLESMKLLKEWFDLYKALELYAKEPEIKDKK